MNKFNGSSILPLKARMSAVELDRREHKRHDRATFRQRVTKSFEVVGNGMTIFDLAIATVYARFKRFAIISAVLWVALVVYLWWAR